MQKTVAKPTKIEAIIGKSRFLTFLFPCPNLSSFIETLNELKKEYPKATHYCFAYRIGNEERYDDDGEPDGSAGFPILNNLKRSELEYCALVIIRYFQPPKLGLGPLTRAYNSLAKKIILEAPLGEIIEKETIKIEVPFNNFGLVLNYCERIGIDYQIEENTEHATLIVITLNKTEKNDDFMQMIQANNVTIRETNLIQGIRPIERS